MGYRHGALGQMLCAVPPQSAAIFGSLLARAGRCLKGQEIIVGLLRLGSSFWLGTYWEPGPAGRAMNSG